MRVVCPAGIGTPIFVVPDSGRQPIAGPFTTGYAARLWILEKLEASLSESHRAVWAALSERMGGVTHDLGVELFLVEQVARGRTAEQLAKYLPRRFDRRDAKALAAGEAA